MSLFLRSVKAESWNWFRWEGLVLESNRVLFYARAPVNTTKLEDVADSLNQQESG